MNRNVEINNLFIYEMFVSIKLFVSFQFYISGLHS